MSDTKEELLLASVALALEYQASPPDIAKLRAVGEVVLDKALAFGRETLAASAVLAEQARSLPHPMDRVRKEFEATQNRAAALEEATP